MFHGFPRDVQDLFEFCLDLLCVSMVDVLVYFSWVFLRYCELLVFLVIFGTCTSLLGIMDYFGVSERQTQVLVLKRSGLAKALC